ncbi:MAG: Oxidoreductase, aldo/keto reductase family, partial [uncultured Arthrobacter sp.]
AFGVRRFAAAVGRGPHRPVLPAPCRPRCAGRGDGGGNGGARAGRQGRSSGLSEASPAM